MFQVKRRLREATVYLGGCNCQPRQRNRNETSPSLLGDREGRARPGIEIHVLTNTIQRKSIQIRLLTVPVGLENSMVNKYSS